MNSNAKSSGNQRVLRVERELQNILGRHLITGLKEPLIGLVTVAGIEVTKDLRSAKVFISQLAEGDDRLFNEEALESQRAEVQRYISHQLKLKFCPVIRFYFNKPLPVESLLAQPITLESSGDDEELSGDGE